MSFTSNYTDRINKLPPYLFVEIDRLKNQCLARGKDIIDLGIGDPDIPTASVIVEAMKFAVENPAYHRYPSTAGMISFRETAVKWFANCFGAKFDPAAEVVSLIGSKEGIGHIPMAFINPGDIALIPDPGYPVYRTGVLFAGGEPYVMPLLEKNNFLPDLSKIPEDVAQKAKLMFLNYPNNPTAAIATKQFFKTVVKFAKKYKIIVCHDAAYTEVCFDGYSAPSFLEAEGAKDVGIEFHSLSKTFCMTGWRVGFAIGNKDIIAGLAKVKSNMDSGVFQAIQEAAVIALTKGIDVADTIYKVFERRRNVFIAGLQKAGLKCRIPKATFYVWIRCPEGYKSADLSKFILEEASVVVTPGNGFGQCGEGFIRAALTVPEDRLCEAVQRIAKIL
ncbi:LL-diaminopimelate aminotransferase [bacterium]|nr:LL-diaminopimelate aminotransferase [bacterium]